MGSDDKTFIRSYRKHFDKSPKKCEVDDLVNSALQYQHLNTQLKSLMNDLNNLDRPSIVDRLNWISSNVNNKCSKVSDLICEVDNLKQQLQCSKNNVSDPSLVQKYQHALQLLAVYREQLDFASLFSGRNTGRFQINQLQVALQQSQAQLNGLVNAIDQLIETVEAAIVFMLDTFIDILTEILESL